MGEGRLVETPEETEGVDAIQLRAAVRDGILVHARAEAPRECCGLLLGRGCLVDECVRSPNVDPDPNRYEIDAGLHVSTNRRLRGSGRAVIGAYHSHPHGPAWPSPSDVAEAYYPEFIWVIASLAGAEPELRAFRVAAGRVIELGIELT
jgi:proteasome lid subunit RPN8/RPN11